MTRRLLCLGILMLSGCRPATLPRSEGHLLPSDVYVITATDMAASCKTHGICGDFQTPPVTAIAEFEKRLPSLLKTQGRDDLAATVPTSYVRQYWAVVGKDGLTIIGNFVCRSSAVYLPSLTSDFAPIPPEWLARAPVLLDDAGMCLVSVTFPASRPQAAAFVFG